MSILLFMAFNTFAQRNDHFDFEKFNAKKIAFITNAINLTTTEAEKFWPLYNEFEKKKFSIMKEHQDLENSLKDKTEDLSDEKYIEISKKMASFSIDEGDLFIEYNEKFLKILPPKKVVQLYVAEMEFKSSLLREYKNRENDKATEKQ